MNLPTERPSLQWLVPHYTEGPAKLTKAQAVHYIVSDRLGSGRGRGKGSNARKRAQKAQGEALARKRAARGWLTWYEALMETKLERQKQLDAEGLGHTTLSTFS
jgi:hypothetical protein